MPSESNIAKRSEKDYVINDNALDSDPSSLDNSIGGVGSSDHFITFRKVSGIVTRNA
jgi:hypothetical protein